MFAVTSFYSQRAQSPDGPRSAVPILWGLRSARARNASAPGASGTRWVAFHWAQLDKHSTAHSACRAAVSLHTAQTGPGLLSICRPLATIPSTPELSFSVGGKTNKTKQKKPRHENMTPGSCALCPAGYKSALYGGPRQGLRDLGAPGFPFSSPGSRNNIWT